MDKLNCGLFIFTETKAKEPDLVHQLERVDDEPSAVDVYARPRTGRGLGPVAAVHPLLIGLSKGCKGDRRCEVILGSSGSHSMAVPTASRKEHVVVLLLSRSGLHSAGSF
jgi:hypothetical protein